MNPLARLRARLADNTGTPPHQEAWESFGLDLVREALGRAEIADLRAGEPATHIRDYGVRVFAQWDEDGIIAYLLRQLGDVPKTFVEVGVQDYTESNTRFLIRQGDWTGVILEVDSDCVARIRTLPESWRYDLRLVESLVTSENINALIESVGLAGEIGVLSIDIDGNDYWVWQALTVVSPTIVVIEFNGRFGPERAVTIPYDATFDRMEASPTGIYYGASLAAMVKLGAEKGYDYVGSNGADTNAFFVRTDRRPPALRRLTAAEGYRALRVREMRDEQGRLLFAGPEEERAVLRNLPVVDV